MKYWLRKHGSNVFVALVMAVVIALIANAAYQYQTNFLDVGVIKSFSVTPEGTLVVIYTVHGRTVTAMTPSGTFVVVVGAPVRFVVFDNRLYFWYENVAWRLG